jgi:quercetin dioxygenase-like cupin family protein
MFDLPGNSKVFLPAKDMEWEKVGHGVLRQIMGYDKTLMMAAVQFDTGSIGPAHEHYHAQVTYVAKGSFEVSIAGETRKLQQGDSFYIPPNTIHGVVCLEAGLLVDVFSPMREDFLDS